MKNTSAFSKRYNDLFEEAQDYCNNNFHQKADRLLNPNKDGNPLVGLVVDALVNILKNYLERSATDKVLNATYLETKFIEPLRFQSWNKIESLN
jgi:hypothetical protein